MSDKLRFKDIKKYHMSIFTTNTLALVLAIFFIRSYRLKGISILPIFFIVIIILALLLIASIFMLKPSGKIKSILPSKKFIFLNMALTLIVSLIFLNQIGFLGFLFTLIFAFFLFEAEHILYEGVKR